MRHLQTLALLAAGAALGACAQPPVACGEYPSGGGPAVIRTRDQQLCELVRQRVLQFLATEPDLTIAMTDRLADRSRRWRYADTLDELVATVRNDAGERLGLLVARAVAAVRASDDKPLPADCDEPEACLVAGAALGAELALAQRAYFAQGRRPPGDAVQRSGLRRINIEDLTD